jgi:hypothetical protein
MREPDSISEAEFKRRLQQSLVGRYRVLLEDKDFRFRDPLRGAMVIYFPRGIDAMILGLGEVGQRYLECARECLDRALGGRLLPFLGWDPVADRPYWDDPALNYHRAIAHITRFNVVCLLDGVAGLQDLDSAISHIRELSANTNGLSGSIRKNREQILCSYLWSSAITRHPHEAVQSAEANLGIKGRCKAVRQYHSERAYVRMLLSVARYIGGDNTARGPAKRSLASLLVAHRDLLNLTHRVYWPESGLGFEWAWLWESAFSEHPDPRRAIEILRGTVSLED